MNLIQLKVGETAVIDRVHVNGALKERLSSLGLLRNESVSIQHFGWFKSTVQVMTNRSLIALRKEEATCIEVHRVA
jgi:Fe2+ transport system protein FeoA